MRNPVLVLLLLLAPFGFLIRGLHDYLMHFAVHFDHQPHVFDFPLDFLGQVFVAIRLLFQE